MIHIPVQFQIAVMSRIVDLLYFFTMFESIEIFWLCLIVIDADVLVKCAVIFMAESIAIFFMFETFIDVGVDFSAQS